MTLQKRDTTHDELLDAFTEQAEGYGEKAIEYAQKGNSHFAGVWAKEAATAGISALMMIEAFEAEDRV